MKRFTDLYLALDGTNSTLEKKDALKAYLSEASDADAAWTIALLTGNRPKGIGATRILRTLCIEVTGYPEWMLDECRVAVGDLSETIALLLPGPDAFSAENLSRTMDERVVALRGADEALRRRIITEAWSVFDSNQRLVYHKLIRGGFRVGVQKRTVTRALAEAHDLDFDLVAHRLTGRFAPRPEEYRRLISPERPDEHRERPYPFFLAQSLARDPSELGDPADWCIEDKWDGIRAQLSVRGRERLLWSRGEEPIGVQFPELLAAADLPTDTVLDGEVLLWKDAGPRSFLELQKRLNRTRLPGPQLQLFGGDEARFIAYDLLEYAGEDLRARPLSERRDRLRQVVADVSSELIGLSESHAIGDWSEVRSHRESARARGTEGVMLKPRDSPYGVGRRSGPGGWLKWKVDPFTADAVMVGAQSGSGRRANLHTDYTFAIWDRAGDEPTLVTFAKAYSGLDQGEIERLDRWIRRNTTSRKGPFRAVKPEQVFELAFDGIQRSNRHKSGFAVRFPRIHRWREDKPAIEADDTVTLSSLLGVGAAS